MRDAKLDRLFQRFREKGDVRALTRVFDLTSRELLELAAHVSRDPAQAEDLLQTTFLVAIERAQSYDGSRSLMPWLVGILTREARLWNRRAARRIEPDLVEPRATDEPSAELEQREFSSALLEAIEKLPELYREVLVRHLRDERTPGQIAREFDRSPGTVRVQLHRGLELLRKALPAGLVAGSLLAVAPRGLAAVRAEVVRSATLAATPLATTSISLAVATGGLVMKQVLVFASVVLLAALGWLAWPRSSPLERETSVAAQSSGADVRPTAPAIAKTDEVPTRAAVESPVPPAAVATTGSLLVKVTWRDDGAVAADVGVEIDVESAPYETKQVIELRTGPDGCVRVPQIDAGSCYIELDRDSDSKSSARVMIEPGKPTEVELSLASGVEVAGVVVDKSGSPVPGPELWLSSLHRGLEGHVVGRCDAEGRFRLRGMRRGGFFGARAPGFAPSDLLYISDPSVGSGNALNVTLELLEEGGSVSGIVLAPDGAPVAHARVAMGSFLAGRQEDLAQLQLNRRKHADGSTLITPYPTWVSTDPDGRFAIEGIECGDIPLVASSNGCAPWYGLVHIDAHAQTRVEVRLEIGASVSGTVSNSDGTPAAGIGVSALGPSVRLSSSAQSNALGMYRIANLAAGEYRVFARATNPTAAGRANTVLNLGPNSEMHWDCTLPGALRIAGRALDEHGVELSGWTVIARGTGGYARQLYDSTDPHGRFTIEGCEDAPYTLELRPAQAPEHGSPSAWLVDVRPGPAEVVLRIDPATAPSARLRGRFVDAQRAPVADLWLALHSNTLNRSLPRPTVEKDGRFEFGPVSPDSYRLYVEFKKFPSRTLGPYELVRDQTLDLGEIVLETPGRMHGKLHAPAGITLSDARLQVLGLSDGNRGEVLATREDGSFESGPLQPGAYALLLRARGCAALRVPFEAIAGKDVPLDLSLAAGNEVTLRFVLPEGQPVSRWVSCKLSTAAGEELVDEYLDNPQRTNPFVFTLSLAAGNYVVEAQAEDELSARAQFDASAGTAVGLRLAH